MAERFMTAGQTEVFYIGDGTDARDILDAVVEAGSFTDSKVEMGIGYIKVTLTAVEDISVDYTPSPYLTYVEAVKESLSYRDQLLAKGYEEL